MLTPELSNEVLRKTSAKYVFSGDDHDYCEVEHMYTGDQGKVKEITVKSFAWTMGIRRPGFLLVSLYNPGAEGLDTARETVKSKLCLLPDQIGVFIRYVQLLAVTLVLVVGGVVVRRLVGRKGGEGEGPILPLSGRAEVAVGMSSSSAMKGSSRTGSRSGTPSVGYGRYDEDESKYLKPAAVREVRVGNGKGWIGGMRDVRDELVAVAWVVIAFYGWLQWRW